MSSRVRFVLVSWLGLTSLSTELARAQTPQPATRVSPASAAQALTERDAAARAVSNNPGLHVALLGVTQAMADVRAEEGLYAPVFTANAGITRTRQPVLRDEGVAIGASDVVDLGAGVFKTFPFGSVIRLDVTGARELRSSETTDRDQLGYSLGATLSLTQPLLRGAGTEVGLASLRAARLRRTAATLSAQQTASALLRDVLKSYWELWYANQVVRIDEASRELAREQSRQAREQVASGALANIDSLVYTTRLAELEEAVVRDTTDRRQRALNLGVFMGEPGREELAASDTPPERMEGTAESARALDDAQRASPELRQLETQIALARDQLKIAGDPSRPRLDLGGSVSVEGLGNREVPPAFEQFGRFEAVSAQVNLTFETPLDGTRHRALVESARLSQHIAEKQLEVTRQRLVGDVLSALALRDAAGQRVTVASETVRVAGEQVEAERRRFAAGISIAIQVQQAEDSFRQAQLRLERARVDAVEADVDLSHLRGLLLERYADVLRRLPAAGPSLSVLPPSPL